MMEGLILIVIGLAILLAILNWILLCAMLKHIFRLFWEVKYEIENENRRN